MSNPNRPAVPKVCENCEARNAKPMHECPYSEIDGDGTLCNCCDYCEWECARDI